jgi:hypothetical protein
LVADQNLLRVRLAFCKYGAMDLPETGRML